MQHMRSAAVPDGEYTAAGTAVLDLIGLHGEHQSVLRVDRDREDVHPGNVEHGIGLGAPPRTRAARIVVHRRGFRSEAWSPLILKAPTPLTPHRHAAPADPLTHAQIRRATIVTGSFVDPPRV